MTTFFILSFFFTTFDVINQSSWIWSFLWDGNCNISYYIPRDTLYLIIWRAQCGKGFFCFLVVSLCIVVELRTRRETTAWSLANADWTVFYLFMIIHLCFHHYNYQIILTPCAFAHPCLDQCSLCIAY
ncbi:hypothetical protein EDB82DRAFT_58325 [Fusarium venenatum]|uniref:uncharacterized protein n=1 Tax=Fusarium venenatum TaxID=56646 RepID=UPI001D4710EA|nr:hypothetical protein EDB82DRAFT_58325 [Fusarium venenatum]